MLFTVGWESHRMVKKKAIVGNGQDPQEENEMGSRQKPRLLGRACDSGGRTQCR